MKSKFFKNAIILTISGIIVRIIATVFNVYISKKIGTEALGVYQMLMSVYLFCINVAVSGLGLTAIKLVSREEALKNTENTARIIYKILLYSLIMGIFAGILLILTSNYIAIHVLKNIVSEKVIYILGVSLPFLSMSNSLNGYFTGKRKILNNSILQVADQLVKVIIMTFLLGIYLPGDIENACIALVLGDTICEFFFFILSYILFKLEKIQVRNIKKDNKVGREIIKIAFPVAITSSIRSGLNAIKQVAIPTSLEKADMSYKRAISEYGIVTGLAIPIVTFMSVFIQPVSSLLLPEFSEYKAKYNNEKINRTIERVLKVTLNYAICVMGGLWLFSDELGEVIYENMVAGWYIKMLSPLVIFMYIDSTVDSMLRGLDKQVGVMLCNILDLVISILFIYFVVPSFGVSGYIASIFLSTILNSTISICILLKTTHFKFKLFEWIICPSIRRYYFSYNSKERR
ncbi:MAG: oligosaccharide flippase family protein [Clostridia bacterium]|nr:oligosaccharide flippase family protein [Clostridia bacterium]